MLKNILLTAVAFALVGLARFAFNAIALNMFDANTSGTLNVALSLGVLLSLPASTTFGATVVRFIGQARGQGRTGRARWVFQVTLSGTVLLALACALAAWVAREPLAQSRGIAASLVAQAALLSIAYVLYLYGRNVLYALDYVGTYTVLEIIGGVIFFVTLGWLAVNGRAETLLFAFILGWLTVALTTTIAGARALLRAPVGPDDRLPLGQLGTYSFFALVGTASSLSIRELAVVFAPSAGGLDDAAYLALSLSLLAPMQAFPRVLRGVVLAHSAELDGRSQLDRLGRSLSEATHWLTLATVPVACGLAVLAEPLIAVAGGEPTPGRVLALQLLVVGGVIDVLATPATNALAGVGAVRVTALSAIAGLVTAAVGWVLLTPRLGLVGVAAGLVLSSIVKSGYPMLVARRSLGMRLTRAPGTVLLLLTASVAAVLLAQLTQAPVIAAIAYAAVALAVLGPAGRELLRFARTRLRHGPGHTLGTRGETTES